MPSFSNKIVKKKNKRKKPKTKDRLSVMAPRVEPKLPKTERKRELGVGERKGQREHQAAKKERRRSERDIFLEPLPLEIYEHRQELEADIFTWLSFFLPGLFSGAWTDIRRNLVEAILYVGQYGGYRCRAGYRGCGKTSITEGVVLFLILTGKLKYIGVVAANGPYAQQILSNIRGYCEGDCGPLDENKDELNKLLIYYPEVILPIVALEGISGVKAISQTVNGERTKIKWSGDKLIFPTVYYTIEGSEKSVKSAASGSIIHARGVDAPLRGMKHGNKRPDLIVGDDWDEEGETDDKTRKKIRKIRGEVAGLGGKRKLAIVMLCNTPKRFSIGYRFSNPMLEPAWSGERYPFILEWPKDDDVLSWCREYVKRRKSEQTEIATSKNPDRLPRKSDKLFLDNTDWIGSAFKVADENKFYDEIGIDGQPIECHAVQHFWNRVADTSEEQAAADMNMNPPEEANEGLEGSDMDAQWFQARSCQLEQAEAQEDAAFRNDVFDCGKYYIHWTVSAWSMDATSRIVSYGVEPTGATREMDDQGAEFLFLETLSRLYDALTMDELYTTQGRLVPRKNVGIDAGYLTSIVYKFKREKGDSTIQPLMGTSDLRTPKTLRTLKTTGKEIKMMGNHFQVRRHNCGGISAPLLLIMSDYWKSFSRSRWKTSVNTPQSNVLGGNAAGSRRLYKPDGTEYGDHRHIGNHLSSAVWNEDKNRYEDGKQNHWSDCDYYDNALAYKAGARLPLQKIIQKKTQGALTKKAPQRKRKKTLAERMAR